MTSDRASRSAPGGRLKSKVLESKFVKAKSDRAKEIESWAKEGRKNVEFMRQSGHLTENVTEDLMLNEKLMELSKSRYVAIILMQLCSAIITFMTELINNRNKCTQIVLIIDLVLQYCTNIIFEIGGLIL